MWVYLCIWRKNAIPRKVQFKCGKWWLTSVFWLPEFETNLCVEHFIMYRIYIIILLTPPFRIHLLYTLILPVKTLVSKDHLAASCTILYTFSMYGEDLQSGSNSNSIILKFPWFLICLPPCSFLNSHPLCVAHLPFCAGSIPILAA